MAIAKPQVDETNAGGYERLGVHTLEQPITISKVEVGIVTLKNGTKKRVLKYLPLKVNAFGETFMAADRNGSQLTFWPPQSINLEGAEVK